MRMRLKGFTLIELLIVVAIIAILAAIAVPNLLEAQVRSKVSRVKADQRTYATALESYCVDFGSYPPSVDPLCTGGSIPFICAPLEEMLLPLSTPVAYVSDALYPEPFNGKAGWIMFRGADVLGWRGGTQGRPADAGSRQTIYTYIALPNAAESMIAQYLPLLIALVSTAPMPPSLPNGITEAHARKIVTSRWWVLSPGPDTFYTFDQYLNETGNTIGSVLGQVGAATIEEFDGIYDPTNGTVSRGEIVRTAAGFFNDKK